MRQTGQGNDPGTQHTGSIDEKLPLTVIYRLPHTFRWAPGLYGVQVEICLADSVANETALVGLKVISAQGPDRALLNRICDLLADLRIVTTLVSWEGELCLFIALEDESVTLCHLKGYGVVVMEDVAFVYLC